MFSFIAGLAWTGMQWGLPVYNSIKASEARLIIVETNLTHVQVTLEQQALLLSAIKATQDEQARMRLHEYGLAQPVK
jgi:hypothetical protein